MGSHMLDSDPMIWSAWETSDGADLYCVGVSELRRGAIDSIHIPARQLDYHVLLKPRRISLHRSEIQPNLAERTT